MEKTGRPRQVAVFGAFCFDLESGQLKKNGIRLRLEDKPTELLRVLIEHGGELVSREELQDALWSSRIHLDFEHGLNKSINKLRTALGDDTDAPKYIETLNRRGYRFIAHFELVSLHASGPASKESLAAGDNLYKRAEVAPLGRALVAAIMSRKSHVPLRRAIATSGLVLLVTVGVYIATKASRRETADAARRTNLSLKFEERDWVLISSFENKTGNSVLDGTLEYALERELSNSQFVNVVPRERISDALRLMRKPLDMKIDAALGREICLRDGGIRTLLTGRVERLGTTYVLSAELIDPLNGVTVASMSEEDPADTQMGAAVRHLSNRVREALGEGRDLIHLNEERLQKVTTPSLYALQLYSQAEELMHHFATQSTAAELLERALLVDPEFASAHLMLGYTYANRGMLEKARPQFQCALDLADTATDRERLFIIASYYQVFKNDVPRAIEAYQGLLRLYPDHYWATNNLGDLYSSLGRWEDKFRVTVRLGALRPDDFKLNEHVACAYFLQGDAEGARRHVERAESLAEMDSINAYAPFVREFPAFRSWSEGDVDHAHAQLKAYDTPNYSPDPGIVWFFYSAFGEFGESERRIRRITDHDDQLLSSAFLDFLKGHPLAARANLGRIKHESWEIAGGTEIVLAERTGLWTKLEKVMQKRPPEDSGIEIATGELALALGRIREGIGLLEKGTDSLRMMPNGAFYLGSESLARAYQRQGNLESALRVLEQASNSKIRAYDCVNNGPMLGAWWMRTELQLADLDRKMGRVREAEQVESKLRKMLIYADSDHPILRELKKRNELIAIGSLKADSISR